MQVETNLFLCAMKFSASSISCLVAFALPVSSASIAPLALCLAKIFSLFAYELFCLQQWVLILPCYSAVPHCLFLWQSKIMSIWFTLFPTFLWLELLHLGHGQGHTVGFEKVRWVSAAFWNVRVIYLLTVDQSEKSMSLSVLLSQQVCSSPWFLNVVKHTHFCFSFAMSK